MNSYDPSRRSLLITGGLAAGVAVSGIVKAEGRTDVDPRVLDGQPVPEPPTERSAGPVKPGRGSMLTGKVAVVTEPRGESVAP